jgi:exodeoxyribonuclease VII small subunit
MSNETEPTPAEQLRYGAAIKELREILDGIEREETDLDALSAQVERAAALIRTCRGRIERTELQVRQILDDLEAPSPEAPAP